MNARCKRREALKKRHGGRNEINERTSTRTEREADRDAKKQSKTTTQAAARRKRKE
jgi:hypothetical protein